MPGMMYVPRQENPYMQQGLNMLQQLAMMKFAHNMRMEERDREIEAQKVQMQAEKRENAELSGYTPANIQRSDAGGAMPEGMVTIGGQPYNRPKPNLYELGGQKFVAYGDKLIPVKTSEENDQTAVGQLTKVLGRTPTMEEMMKYKQAGAQQVLTPYQQESLAIRKDTAAESADVRRKALDVRKKEVENISQIREEQLNLRQQLADEKKQVAMAKDASLQRSVEFDLNALDTTINKLIDHPGLDNITGYVGRIPISLRQSTRDAQAQLEKIKANLIVNTLQNLRQSSVSGSSGFGQLSERENATLEKKLAALNEATSKEQIISELEGIKDWSNNLRTNMRKTYKDTWEGRAPKNMKDSFSSPDDVKAAFSAGKIKKEEALKILKDEFGME